ncbi:hypothetical protein [Pseudomonas sp. Marseille-P9899]|uniref:hypothetical protein n=1 Tax=Pseudomonas sp. Marseille-P9899 TaxID=2730401 RepID=UPI00158A9924|nr:hypothetical protein [Pseudomonas sp. Marseille-P9899]
MFDNKYRDQRGKSHNSEQDAEHANSSYLREEDKLNEGNLCRADIFIVLGLLILSMGIFVAIPKALSQDKVFMAFQMLLLLVGSWGLWGLGVWKIPVAFRGPLYFVIFIGGLFYLGSR